MRAELIFAFFAGCVCGAIGLIACATWLWSK